MTAPPARHIELERAWNFRDLGGYETVDGRRVKWRRVFRSAGIDGLSDGDLLTVGGLGIRVVYDFRRDRELAERLIWFERPDAPRRVRLPIGGASATDDEFHRKVMAGEIREIPASRLVKTYLDFSLRYGSHFGIVLRGLAEPDDLPALFHCVAGKDRTGFTAMLLLAALGVPDETIVEDYALTESLRRPGAGDDLRAKLEAIGSRFEDMPGYFGAPPEVMRDVLAHLHETYGSVEGYLDEEAGVPAATVNRLRDLLLD
jgi:protein-tyrosine phosphatase